MRAIGLKYCRAGHVLGQMRATGARLPVFELYRQAIDYQAEPRAEVDVIAIIHGRATNVRCSICGTMIVWHEPGQRQGAGRMKKGKRKDEYYA